MTMLNECSKVKSWVENAEKVQLTLKKYQDPPISLAEVQKIGTELVNVIDFALNSYIKRFLLEM